MKLKYLALSALTFCCFSRASSLVSLQHLIVTNPNPLTGSSGEPLTDAHSNQLLLSLHQTSESKSILSTGLLMSYNPSVEIKRIGFSLIPQLGQVVSFRFDLGFRPYHVDAQTLCHTPYVKSELGSYIGISFPIDLPMGGDKKMSLVSGYKDFFNSEFNLFQIDFQGTHGATILTLPLGIRRTLSKELGLEAQVGYQKIFGGNTLGSSLLPIRADVHYSTGSFRMGLYYKLAVPLTDTALNPDVEQHDYFESKFGFSLAHQFGSPSASQGN